jgi:uncharacterized protein (DUF58 family)
MDLLSGGRSSLIDLAVVVLSTFLGYAWAGPVGGLAFGGSLFVVFLLSEIYLKRPAKQLERFEERINELEDDDA